MGPSQSRLSVTQFNPQDWIVEKEIGYCVLYRNIKSGQIVEEYEMIHKGNLTIQQQLQFYEYRKSQKKHLVSVVAVRKRDSTRLCTGKDEYKIYTERIPFRLTQVDYLSFPQALMVIRDSLIGYDQIKQSYFGLLKVTNQMIGFTLQGEVKVWINQQFYLNTPDKKHIAKGYSSSMAVITQIFALVKNSMTDQSYPEKFLIEMEKLNESLTYEQAIIFINEFAIKNGIQIPQRLVKNQQGRDKVQNQNKQIHQIHTQIISPLPNLLLNGRSQQYQTMNNTNSSYLHNLQMTRNNRPSNFSNLPPPIDIPVRSVPIVQAKTVQLKNIQANPQQTLTRVQRKQVEQRKYPIISKQNPPHYQQKYAKHHRHQHVRNYSDGLIEYTPINQNFSNRAQTRLLPQGQQRRPNRFQNKINQQTYSGNHMQMISAEKRNQSPNYKIVSSINQIPPIRRQNQLPNHSFVRNQQHQCLQVPTNNKLIPHQNQSFVQKGSERFLNKSSLNSHRFPELSNNVFDSQKVLKGQMPFLNDSLNERIDMLTASILKQVEDYQLRPVSKNNYY